MRAKLKDFFSGDTERRGEIMDVKIDEIKIKEIAVIGMAVKMPMAESLEEFWHIISNGIDCIRNFPLSRRKDTDDYLKCLGLFNEGTAYNEYACLDEIDKFDCGFFNISPGEASLMDPHQRLFLETAWKAIEDSGYGGDRLAGSRTGVYAGHIGQPYYKKFISDIKPSDLPLSVSGNIPQMVASRISYILNLKGPSMLVDTACSSSLVAVHLACQAIKNGECAMAIAGGIKINMMPVNSGERFGVESSDGRTRTFDESSDGTGNGEGAAAVILKPLKKALEDRDRIYAVIKGSFINQDGSSVGITAPNTEAQEDVIVKAWKNAGVDPKTISYIEVHGTATRLGDPVEVEGIKRAFRRFNTPYQFCAAGSVKTNLGHLDNAAGITGLVKCILAMKYGIIPPSIHFIRPNKKIRFEASPIYVNTKARQWTSINGPRRCGVNSFGIGGTNCHMVLEEAPLRLQSETQAWNTGILILTLSAKKLDALKEIIKEYNAVLQNYPESKARDICYSACTGRGHYKYRLAVIARSCTELKAKLEKMISLDFDRFGKIEGVFFGSHRIVNSNSGVFENGDLTMDEKTGMNRAAACKTNEFILSEKTDMAAVQDICSFYAKGADIDWCNMYREDGLVKISLPAYPFRKERCWLEVPLGMQADLNKDGFYYRLAWKEESTVIEQRNVKFGRILVFKGELDLCSAVIDDLKKLGADVIEVHIGKEYRKVNDSTYETGNSSSDFGLLLKDIGKENIAIILHMSALREDYKTDTLDGLEGNLEQGVYSLFRLNKALSGYKWDSGPELTVIADHAYEITGKEAVIKPENAALFGLVKVMNIENSNFGHRCIDIDDNTDSWKIACEVIGIHKRYKVAFRDGTKYTEHLEKLDLSDVGRLETEISGEGVYIITGGTGGLGLQMAKFLSSRNKVKIALINRTEIPDRSIWDEIIKRDENRKTCEIINTIREIESRGSTVKCLRCDISVENDLFRLFADIRDTFGSIRGIIHCAGVGVGKTSGILAETSEKELKDALAAKIQGTWLLQKLTMEDNYDFLAVFTSPITLMGGFGQGGYTCANSYLDSFVCRNAGKGKRTFAAGWGPWEATVQSMGALYNEEKQLFRVLSTEKLKACFEELLDRDVRTVFVGNLNFKSTIFNHSENEIGLNFSNEIKACVKSTCKSNFNHYKSKADDSIESVVLVGKGSQDLSGVKAQVGQIIGKVLGLVEINIHDNFYELGGDSIHAMRVINLINKHLGIKIEISEMLKHPTVERFMDYFHNEYSNREKGENCFAVIGSAGKRDFYPLSSAQKRLFILNQAEGENTDYNWPIILKLKGPINGSRLESAFKELADRHEMLRTSYRYMDGEPVQIIHEKVNLEISYISSEKDNVQEIIKDSIKPYNLGRIPLFKIVLIVLNSEEHILFFDMHHIISDGITTDILIREFSYLYNGNRLPPVKIQYKDYACWQNEIMQTEYMKKQEEYWLSKLCTVHYTELPQKSSVSMAKKDGAEIKLQLDEDLARTIDDFCAGYKVTRYVFMFSIFNIILYKETGQENICVGTPVMGRRHTDLENTVGIFLNVLCLSTSVNSKHSFADYMNSVNAAVLEAWDNQDYPYEELYSKLSEGMKLKSLFSILFNYVPFIDEDPVPLDGLSVEKYNFDIAPKYNMTLYIREGKTGLLLDAVYIASYYERFRIKRILDNMVILIRRVLIDANILIRDIGFMQETQNMPDVSLFDQHFDNEEFL
jgi:surfactin family lipopeptide synthetase A